MHVRFDAKSESDFVEIEAERHADSFKDLLHDERSEAQWEEWGWLAWRLERVVGRDCTGALGVEDWLHIFEEAGKEAYLPADGF